MFLFHRPSSQTIESFLATQRHSPFSYSEVGASRGKPPAGYNVDHYRIKLGVGEKTYAEAKRAVQLWKMFDLGWCSIYPPNAPLEEGVVVAALISHFGFWSLNASRIVYLMEEQGSLDRYGFAYGTLRDHGEIGEERFSVEWDREEGSVWYDLYAFSRPGHLLARLGYVLTRRLQKRFARESKEAMVRSVGEGS